MSTSGTRYVYSGHAIGVAAQFHRLFESTGLHHVVPALGAVVLPVTGGLAHSKTSGYSYPVNDPQKLALVTVGHVESRAEGFEGSGGFVTDVHSKIEDLHVVEKLHIDHVELHMTSTRTIGRPPSITTRGNHIRGMRLGNVKVTVHLNSEILCNCTNKQQFAAFHATQPNAAPLQDHNGHYLCSLVSGIELNGPPEETALIPKPQGNKIVWPGFGTIYLGEVLVGENHRRMTLVRLDMGSDAGGSGSIGDASTNGSLST